MRIKGEKIQIIKDVKMDRVRSTGIEVEPSS